MFAEWNKGELDSYLIEITREDLREEGRRRASRLVDKILDRAGQKGTGKWTAISRSTWAAGDADCGSVFARCLSALKDERVAASKVLHGPKKVLTVRSKKEFIEDVRRALYCSKMISYAQGYMLLRAVGRSTKWNLNMGGIALMWRGGCIIRSGFLGRNQGGVRQESEAAEPAAR